jgi:hypothetical protein
MRLSLRRWLIIPVMLAVAGLGLNCGADAQISPTEITNPRLKQAEQTYFQKLIDCNRAISQMTFPFPFVLSRFAGLDVKQQVGADTRGLEFIRFNDRVVLKISGDYNAAFNAQMLTQNQRANRVLDNVIVPILQLLPKYFPPPLDFDGVGFEIAYHVRTNQRSYSYEGREVLTIVFSKADAFRYASVPAGAEQQEILDSSQVYVNGTDFGLALGQRDPSLVAESGKGIHNPPVQPAASVSSSVPPLPSSSGMPLPGTEQRLSPGFEALRAPASPSSAIPAAGPVPAATPAITQADADALQTKLQAELQALDQEGRAHAHFVDYAPPSFVIFRKQIYLQMTLRNPTVFDPDATSIYRRAARSFDLFLAPRLKTLLAKIPDDPAITGLDITVLTEFSAKATSSSEAIEFVCPIGPLRQFAGADITNQDLINQSVVLVNGVRIALNLQQVE